MIWEYQCCENEAEHIKPIEDIIMQNKAHNSYFKTAPET
jgi:hypothetical protein